MTAFWKKRAKTRFLALANQAIFWKAPKTTWLWQSAVTKPLPLQNILTYPWKDNFLIFPLTHSFSESSHQCSHGDLLKKVAWSGTIPKSRNISSSFVLYDHVYHITRLTLLSKSIAVFAFGSGFSLIFSMTKSRILDTGSTPPVIRQTLSLVPVKKKSKFTIVLGCERGRLQKGWS